MEYSRWKTLLLSITKSVFLDSINITHTTSNRWKSKVALICWITFSKDIKLTEREIDIMFI